MKPYIPHMIVDSEGSADSQPPSYDVCIVGSGPAGGTLARELARGDLRVCVLESGVRKPTARGDRLRRVVSDGIRIKDYSRERVLGGASTSWAGLSSPLDLADLAPRTYLRQSGWPIPPEELYEYYEEAAREYRFPELELFGPSGFGALRSTGDAEPVWKALDEKVFLAADDPQNFGREWLETYERDGVDLYLDATVARLEAGSDGRVEAVVTRNASGAERRFTARAYVLATGGLENARLLLNSKRADGSALGNEHDQVGRHLMNHPKNYHGIVRLRRPVQDLPYYFGCLYEGYAGYAGMRLPEDEQRERELMNAYVRMEPLFPWSDNRGIEALVLLAKSSRFLFSRWKSRQKGKIVALRDYAETGDDSDTKNERKGFWDWVGLVGLVIVNLPRVAQYAYYRLLSGKKPAIKRVRLRNFMEMEPDPENRVLLSDELDELGQPLPLVRHRPTERDRKSLIALHERLVEEFEQAGFGRLETELASASPWPIDQDASHHMGTTRMGTDPAHSVVDPTGRVHSVPNLYAAGASVFPTSGCANPTFTIVALSIRLARTLRAELSGSSS